jgi:hypothetical protein
MQISSGKGQSMVNEAYPNRVNSWSLDWNAWVAAISDASFVGHGAARHHMAMAFIQIVSG